MKQLLVIDTGFDHKQPPGHEKHYPKLQNIERKQTTTVGHWHKLPRTLKQTLAKQERQHHRKEQDICLNPRWAEHANGREHVDRMSGGQKGCRKYTSYAASGSDEDCLFK